eukprot:10854246-Alexandrium_andersonii.AAC.1
MCAKHPRGHSATKHSNVQRTHMRASCNHDIAQQNMQRARQLMLQRMLREGSVQRRTSSAAS